MTGSPPEGKLGKQKQDFQFREHQRLAYFRNGPSLECPNIFASVLRPNFAHLKKHPYKAKLRSLPSDLSATQTSKPEPRIRPSRKSASHRSNLCSLEKPFWVVLQEYCSSNEVPILRIDMRSR